MTLPGSIWHVAEAAGAVRGFQWVEPHRDLPPGVLDIATFVAPTAQGVGIGSRLFDATRAAAKAAGATNLEATILATNSGGLIYYQSRGFERVGTMRGTDGRDRVTMRFRLRR